jgi:hypothetical protein
MVVREFYNGLNIKEVEEYLDKLTEMKEKLDIDFEVREILGVDREHIEELEKEISKEKDYGLFYLELIERREQQKNLYEWVFAKLEDRKKTGYRDWAIKGDLWSKDNGRIIVEIEIDRSSPMADIRLSIRNSSKTLKFTEDKDIENSRLKNEDNISKKVEEYKAKAETLFKERLYPQYCYEYRQFEKLKELLHINEVEI